jgi:hypothetical protein
MNCDLADFELSVTNAAARLIKETGQSCIYRHGAGRGVLSQIIREMLMTRTSERQGRIIDHEQDGSMEK